jgi:signal transduction histidine kinase
VSELQRLCRENERLSDEVKRLVKTERQLYEIQEHLDGQMRTYRQLYEIGKKFNATLDITTILQMAAQFVLYGLNFERTLVLMQEAETACFSVQAMDGYYDGAERRDIARLVLPTDSLALAPLYDGIERLLCAPDCKSGELDSLRRMLGMDEYVILPLGGEPKNPVGLLAAGNTAERAHYHSRIVQEGEAMLGLANLASQTSTAINNASFYQALARERQSLEKNVRERTSDLQETLDQQTATAEVLRVINSSPGDLAPVFDAMLEKALRLCDAAFGVLQTYDGDHLRAVALRGAPDPLAEVLRQPRRPSPLATQRLLSGEPYVQIANAAGLSPSPDSADIQASVEIGRVRTILLVPLRKDNDMLGVFSIYRQEARTFTDKQIALLQNFASQAVIAMEDARLLGEIRAARDSAESSLRDLKAAQANLIQAEKMASLGQLTAGIAHEIKNPLNFVNNFASLSVELLDELKEVMGPAMAVLDADKSGEANEVIDMLSGNLEKITEHGRRADGIVKSMLEHSRGVTGERREVDFNGLIDEALNLAYHGARAQDVSFNITLEREFDPALAPVELAPQEMTRVLLNLFGNGFYAVVKRQRDDAEPDFRPTLMVTTRDLLDAVEVRIRDNGVGIEPETKDKLFQPFFTTKPTGEGTGLGLSISYDIVTQQHGGTIEVDSRVGEFTEFTIRLPRHRRATATEGAA